MVQHTTPLELVGSRGVARVSTGLPPSPDLGGGKVRGRSSLAVSAGTAGAAVVEAGKAQPARGVQKPSVGLGKNGPRVFSWLLLV